MAILVIMSLTICLALTDIIVKSYVEGDMKQGEERTFVGGKVILRKIYNKGMCLNFLEHEPGLVKVASTIVGMLLTIYQLLTLFRKKHFLKKVGLSLMAAGAWSNLFDRWIRGYVIDYVGFRTKWKKCTEITYNLGDFFIFGGSILLVLSSLFHTKKKRNESAPQ